MGYFRVRNEHRDVVKELGVSIHTVRIWLNRGWLKAKRVHGIHTY